MYRLFFSIHKSRSVLLRMLAAVCEESMTGREKRNATPAATNNNNSNADDDNTSSDYSSWNQVRERKKTENFLKRQLLLTTMR